MRVIFRVFTLFVLFVSLTGCPFTMEPPISSMWIYNESEQDVCVYLYQNPILINGQFYPDTVLPKKEIGYYSIKSKRRVNYEFEIPPTGDPVYSFFIFDAKVIETESWDSIRSGYKILMRYDLHVNDEHLRPLNLKITYPPSENMKDIHIYPPYDGWDK